MRLNLLTDAWLPVLLRSGAKAWVSLPGLVARVPAPSGSAPDYAVDFAWGRPDLDMACHELCIGLLQICLDVRDEDDWFALWRGAMTGPEFAERLQPLAFAFELTGDGPRFLQDPEPFEAGVAAAAQSDVEALFIDTPGQNGQKKNADVLTHRGRYPALGLPAAAMALYALQAFAPAGGAGIRTSLRGGGPLSVLVIPQARPGSAPVPLWRRLLANVTPEPHRLKAARLASALPWLAPVSQKGGTSVGADSKDATGGKIHPDPAEGAHPLQAFFGMPRRIRLVPGPAAGRCALTGCEGPVVTGFVQKPHGLDYGLWQHPLTPYRRLKKDGEPYTVKPKSGRFGYRDWVSVALSSEEGVLADMPRTVAQARKARAAALLTSGRDPLLRVGGWAMNNMEAMAFLSAEQPMHLAGTEDQARRLTQFARSLAAAGGEAASALREAVRMTVLGEASKADGDKGVFAQAQSAFFAATEAPFHDITARALLLPAEATPDDMAPLRQSWLRTIQRTALAQFDFHAPLPLADPQRAKRLVKARNNLLKVFLGYDPAGNRLYEALGLPKPEPKVKPSASGKTRKQAKALGEGELA
ncbi:MAG: type I-E CRISPR-associated protein Cse1/CasA [Pannonibacter sp.]